MKSISLLILLFLSSFICLAQPNNPSNPVPLDGGNSLLVIGGSLYAGYKIRREFNKDDDSTEE